ncbi:MAG: hypothetical protein E4H27_03805 [Anaerolineales bacterium]|nr:MAG: hypothetical protein E4H27_03805 [Anaerolineales bacterium]
MNQVLKLVFPLCVTLVLVLTGCRHTELLVPAGTVGPTLRVADSPGTWSGSDMLLFSAGGDLVTMRPDGSERYILTAPVTYEGASAWSPDGLYVAYAAAEAGNGDIWIAPWNVLGDPERYTNITQRPDVDDSGPCWSPDGRHIAFASFRNGNWGIYTADLLIYEEFIDPLVLQQQRLTINKGFEGHPAWFPDGSWIAYTSDRGFRWQIYLTDPDGAYTIPMTGTTNLRSTAYPAWSPDGSYLAFASTFDENWDIYVMQTDGSGLKQLTSHPAADWHPAWSPDGRWIAFVSDRSGISDIYLVSADGMVLIQVTNTVEPEDYPVWQVPISEVISFR